MASNDVDLLIRAAVVHTFAGGHRRQRALAVRGDRVVALSADPNGLDSLVPDRATDRAVTFAA